MSLKSSGKINKNAVGIKMSQLDFLKIHHLYKMVFLKEKYQIAMADQKLTSVEITRTPTNVRMTLKLAS